MAARKAQGNHWPCCHWTKWRHSKGWSYQINLFILQTGIDLLVRALLFISDQVPYHFPRTGLGHTFNIRRPYSTLWSQTRRRLFSSLSSAKSLDHSYGTQSGGTTFNTEEPSYRGRILVTHPLWEALTNVLACDEQWVTLFFHTS